MRAEEKNAFLNWQKGNRYYGKRFSILGDSTSTLLGYNPYGYNVFYEGERRIASGVMDMSDTWWGQVIEFFGGELLVNNSWSGSRVTKLPGADRLFPAGCSDERTSGLHTADAMPDVILVRLGGNDWGFGAKTSDHRDPEDMEEFGAAYARMLEKLKKNYPQSEIWCGTMGESGMSSRLEFHFPHDFAGTHIDRFNHLICAMAAKYDCRLVDMREYHMPYDTIDGSHPTAAGMTVIATRVIRALGGAETEVFLNCAHDLAAAEEYTDSSTTQELPDAPIGAKTAPRQRSWFARLFRKK